ncbi:lysis protein [Pseudomonas sp. SDI]|uniref:lysis system i-spanin subunit Rz n=1 Tax=Pseudomonas sp. SDI TaxID=2170734 RepID=UPI000DE65F8A|nr:lysis system i-spanin subunit Rz [Pseudomonas sp. SDI]PWB34627.1 lysis protein [Pseudomonas sp. SDI]
MSRLKAVLLLIPLLLAVALTWHVQAWRYGRELAQREQAHVEARRQQAEASTRQLLGERQQRRVLEQQIELNDNSHYQELLDAQQAQARLRDRLATADLRLSALLASDSNPNRSMPATPGAGGVDHGPVRARLDPAHARRIIAITDAGDAGLIALRACQGYVRALAR